MNVAFYKSVRLACRFVKVQCIRELVLHRHRADRAGGFILACTHISHLEAFAVGLIVPRPVHWISRIEFFKRRWAAAIMLAGGAVPVDRTGFSLPAVRRAIRLATDGRVIGIFPEGAVTQGARSVLRGGPIKQGVCTIAIRSRVPVVPVVILGTEKLNRVGPWLPARRGRVWVAFGRDVLPPARQTGNRAARAEMASRLTTEFRATYHELLAAASLRDEDVA
ncbi:MAG: lysophospholipid acyltransferase family protein [Phycisphaerales bacterium]